MLQIARAVTLLAVVTCFFATSESSHAMAPVRSSPKPIFDDTGATLYAIELKPNAQEAFPDSVPPEVARRFARRHDARHIAMAHALELRFGFQVETMTSWVGNTLGAYLNNAQVEALAADPLVVRLIEDERARVEYSAAPPWSDYSPVAPPDPAVWGAVSYGTFAVNGLFSVETGFPRIYVLDAGVGHHADQPPTITRVAPTSGVDAVGCYSHATAVAAVISATTGNAGTTGVIPNAPIISVSHASVTAFGPDGQCGSPDSATFNSHVAALDWIKWDHYSNGGQYHPAVVNISWNGTTWWGPNGLLNPYLESLATPYVGGYVYRGAFVAQSAGNGYTDACAGSYSSPSPTDGIMVAGGVNRFGDAVTPSNGGYSTTPANITGNEPGSNFGACVDVWAPSQEIWLPWGPLVGWSLNNFPGYQYSTVNYNNYVRSGGTSFAAPLVAAVAAQLQRANGYSNSSELEAAVRARMFNVGKTDATGRLIQYTQIQ